MVVNKHEMFSSNSLNNPENDADSFNIRVKLSNKENKDLHT